MIFFRSVWSFVINFLRQDILEHENINIHIKSLQKNIQ